MAEVRPSGFRSAIYRPFFRQHFYMDRVLNNSPYQIPTYFPTPGIRNPAILRGTWTYVCPGVRPL